MISHKGTCGVGVLLAEEWVDDVLEVKRISDRICLIKINVVDCNCNCPLISIHAPQLGLDDRVKDAFSDELQCAFANISEPENLFLCGDFNGLIDCTSEGYGGVHGGVGLDERNTEGEKILEFSVANQLVICNFLFKKRVSHLVTYHSGDSSTLADYALARRRNFKFVSNIKVLLNGKNALLCINCLCVISKPF